MLSSTRAEAAALMQALTTPQSLHVAIDNVVVVLKFNVFKQYAVELENTNKHIYTSANTTR